MSSNAKCCAKVLPGHYIDPSNTPMLSLLCKCGNQGPERLSYLPKVTQDMVQLG